MKINKNKVVELHITFYDAQGQELGQEQCTYLHGGYGDILPKIEAALDQTEVGHETRLYLEPDDAFGEYNPALMYLEPRANFPDDVAEGMIFEGLLPEGGASDVSGIQMLVLDDDDEDDANADVDAMAIPIDDDDVDGSNMLDIDNLEARRLIFVVQQVTPTHVLVDANPQWAGMALQLLCKVENIRTASASEIAQQSAEDSDDEFNIHELFAVGARKKTLH